jgi:hypothetical protein
MTPPYSVHTTPADTTHAKASAAKRLRSNGLLGRERTRLCSAIQKEFVLELVVVHVTTRIVLRVKKVVTLSAIFVKTKC